MAGGDGTAHLTLETIDQIGLRRPGSRCTEKTSRSVSSRSDSPVGEVATVDSAAVLIFDGLFLSRPELAQHRDVTVFLDADARRESEWLDFLLDDLPADALQRAALLDDRLRRALAPLPGWWRAYVEATRPANEATLVIDNNDVRSPVLVKIR